MPNAIDFGRVRSALFQEARRRHLPTENVEGVVAKLPDILALCGPYSNSRHVANHLGQLMVAGPLRVLAPTCPDYTHLFGRYTFRGVGSGLPLLARRHIAFLDRLATVLPDMRAHLLLADHEADDQALCAATRCDRAEFLSRMRGSLATLREEVGARGWSANLMTDVIRRLVAEEAAVSRDIEASSAHARHIEAENEARLEMYRRIGEFTDAQKRQRTLRTAAQYVVLGRFAKAGGFAVCNHTTTNLAWYLRENVAVLHNATKVY